MINLLRCKYWLLKQYLRKYYYDVMLLFSITIGSIINVLFRVKTWINYKNIGLGCDDNKHHCFIWV